MRMEAPTTPTAVARSPTPCTTASGRSSTRPRSALRYTSAAPTTRSTAPTGRRIPRPCSGDFDAFQWVIYWGDRPAMELTAALILHNFFGRFPNIKVLLSEMGTVWLPYTPAQGRPRVPDRAARPSGRRTVVSTGARRRSSASTSSSRPSPRRTSGASSTRSASIRSSSDPTFPTAKVWRIHGSTSTLSSRRSPKTNSDASCATPWSPSWPRASREASCRESAALHAARAGPG